MKLKSVSIGLIIIVLLFGGIYMSKILNIWQTESSKIPTIIKEGEYAGMSDPNDIRGSYSLEDIEKVFEIPSIDIARAFGISNLENYEDIKLKDFETIYSDFEQEVGTGSVRVFVAFYKGLPVDLLDDNYLLKDAAPILEKQGKMSDIQREYLFNHIIDKDNGFIDNIKTGIVDNSENEENEENLVKGNTLVGDLFEYGLSESDIKEVLGEVPNRLISVKDYCIENSLSFSEIKLKLQNIIDLK